MKKNRGLELKMASLIKELQSKFKKMIEDLQEMETKLKEMQKELPFEKVEI